MSYQLKSSTFKDKLYNIAFSVRQSLFQRYNIHPDFYDLVGYCGKAAAQLHSSLATAGIPGTICYNSNHIFNSACGHYIDITATQFNQQFPQVLIFQDSDQLYSRSHHWKIEQKLETVQQLYDLQVAKLWPHDQIISLSDLELTNASCNSILVK